MMQAMEAHLARLESSMGEMCQQHDQDSKEHAAQLRLLNTKLDTLLTEEHKQVRPPPCPLGKASYV